ncbi:MAG: heat-inducible transcriptional repressor, partial [Solirubrobacterales bacterium]|nr:heat-inducible transcriptional repressor [Solirubrobacterales bacterium]
LLTMVVDSYLESGRPVGSRAISSLGAVRWSASTVRAELAALERDGFLTHPHTSAGRVPTESGYRFYVDSLLESESRLPATPTAKALELTRMRREVEEAMRETTAALAKITDLVALVSAPPLETASIHRVEVLLLQPQVVMVVVITSAGDITKRVFRFAQAVDPGLVDWASSYLNERLAGIGLGARTLADRLRDPELGAAESAFLSEIAGAFRRLGGAAEESLYVDGTAHLLSEEHVPDLPRAEDLMRALEQRVGLLGMLRSAIDLRSVFLWIGAENPQPQLRSVSVVGANYGLGYRNLGSVGVIGPLRMDYATAIASVRDAAGELSRFFETVYED